MTSARTSPWLLRAGAVAALLLSACAPVTSRADTTPPRPAADWAAVTQAADGHTVRWWMYGGDERANRYVDEHVVPAAAQLGVTLERVPVADTADAVQRVIAEQRAGRDAGGVDLVWVNGVNFALGKEADAWLTGWTQDLPRADLLDPEDAALTSDFGVAVEGQELPWSRAAFVFAYDKERIADPPTSFDELLDFARQNPGRFTYPAPPDFTGSAFVRQAVASLGEDRALDVLDDLKPLQWRDGEAFPGSEAELNQLFGDGEVDIAMSYDPAFVATGVRQGVFPPSTRPFVLEDGTLQNTSFVAIPANAANRNAALVVADLLLDPALQAVKADPDVWGMPTVLDPGRVPGDSRASLDTATGPHILSDLGRPVIELPVDDVAKIGRRWKSEVLP
jgi:putative spermidine/putrescine transport system substrate-binding protein